MGTIFHDAILVTVNDYVFDDDFTWPNRIAPPDVDAFRKQMPEWLRRFLIGPFESHVNGYLTWVFLPDGSKEGWEPSSTADEWREKFVALFSGCYDDGSGPFEVVGVRWGSDLEGYDEKPHVTYTERGPVARTEPVWLSRKETP